MATKKVKAVRKTVKNVKSKGNRKSASKKVQRKSQRLKKPGTPAKKKAVKQVKPTRAVKAAKASKRVQKAKAAGKRQSGLDAAARVLKETGKPMKVRAIVDKMLTKSYWKTGGRTPWATLYSAIIREIATKGGNARFKKTERGTFALKA